LAASAISSVATVQAEEECVEARGVTLDEIPAPARDAILTAASGGTLTQVHEECWAGKPMYEGHIRKGRSDSIIWVDAEGNILHRH
jgi:hypothetical protein